MVLLQLWMLLTSCLNRICGYCCSIILLATCFHIIYLIIWWNICRLYREESVISWIKYAFLAYYSYSRLVSNFPIAICMSSKPCLRLMSFFTLSGLSLHNQCIQYTPYGLLSHFGGLMLACVRVFSSISTIQICFSQV